MVELQLGVKSSEQPDRFNIFARLVENQSKDVQTLTVSLTSELHYVMNDMSESLVSTSSAGQSTRVDAAHDLMTNSSNEEQVAWMSLAGRDPASTTEQLDRQTSELLGYVQQQNEELDARQAELNAKLAQLDNQLRTARLHREGQAGTDLLEPPATASEPSIEPVDDRPANEMDVPHEPLPESAHAASSPSKVQEFEEVQQLVEQIMGRSSTATDAPSTGAASAAAPDVASEYDASGAPVLSPMSSVDSYPDMVTDSHLGHALPRKPMPPMPGARELDADRGWLAEQKRELDRRRIVLDRMQEETQATHRESLEMRYVTEQLWAQLSGQVSAEQITELLQGLRTQLDGHYETQSKQLESRKAELDSLQAAMDRKQEDLRRQSQKLQEWVEARHDQIKSHAAEVDAKEALLDQREHRIREEISRWEAQRTTHQQQVESLLAKLNLTRILS